MICTEESIRNFKKQAERLSSFLSTFQPLIDSYVLDYFTENNWSKLLPSWQSVLDKLEFSDLALFLNFDHVLNFKEVWPLSLQAFRATASALALSRKPVISESVKHFLDAALGSTSQNLVNIELEKVEYDFRGYVSQNKNLAAVFRKHVKPKKQHEIFRLAQLIDVVLQKMKIHHVVDIGSGLGHLARVLSLQYNFKVVTIDAISKHTSTAISFDKQAISSLQKSVETVIDNGEVTTQRDQVSEAPYHLESIIAGHSSKNILQNVLCKAWAGETDKIPLCLVGLHTCGDLAPTVLNLFIEMPQCRAVFSVGCCYMKLNEKKEFNGYPLSTFVRSIAASTLSYKARELSCHALEGYIKKLKGNYQSLKIHCYRAILEKIIQEYHPDMKHLGLRSVKNAEDMLFFEYATKALARHPLQIPIGALQSSINEIYLKEWKRVVIVYSLRLMTAPVIETLILIDRMIYLSEKGISSCILPTFDPFVSPRNLVLVGIKKPFEVK